MNDWIKEFPSAVTVCDKEGIVLEMNEKAQKTFEKDGGIALIGKNLFDCHPEGAKIKVIGLLSKKQTNVYTIEKNGIKKMIYQSPWLENGEFAGFVEMSLEIPMEIPHFIRA